MTNREGSRHLDERAVRSYLSGSLAEDRAREAEEHIAECRRCADLARSAVSSENIWNEWSPRAYGDTVLLGLVEHGLEAAATREIEASRIARMQEWRRRVGPWLENAQVVVLDASEPRIEVNPFGPQTSRSEGGAHGTRCAETRRPSRSRDEGSTERQDDADPEVCIESESLHLRARMQLSHSAPLGWLRTASDGMDVTIDIDWIGDPGRAPLVLLVPDDAPENARVSDARIAGASSPAGGPRQARFSAIGRGSYLVALEPSEDLLI